MKTMAETLRDADPLTSEPRRSPPARFRSRQIVLDASRTAGEAPQRRVALATLLALAIAGIVFGFYQSSRTAVDVLAAVRFEVRLAEEAPAPGLREVVIAGTDRKIYLHAEPIAVNGDIVEARVVPGDGASTFGVAVTLNTEGGAKMRSATQDHIGRPVAILIDGEVIAVPTVRSAVSASAMISGNFTRAEAERIVAGILGR